MRENRCSSKDIVLLVFSKNGKIQLLWAEHLGQKRYKLFEAVKPFQIGDIVYFDKILEENGLIERPQLNEQTAEEFLLEMKDLWLLLGETAKNT